MTEIEKSYDAWKKRSYSMIETLTRGSLKAGDVDALLQFAFYAGMMEGTDIMQRNMARPVKDGVDVEAVAENLQAVDKAHWIYHNTDRNALSCEEELELANGLLEFIDEHLETARHLLEKEDEK